MENLKILIPTDFSEQSDYALAYAQNLTTLFNVEVVLLHILETNDAVNVNSEDDVTDLLGVNIDYLSKVKTIASNNLKTQHDKNVGVLNKIKSIIKIGPLTETIISTSREHQSDMILMGTKGASGIREWLSGSDTQIVARHSEIPVLTIMCDRKDEVIRNILFISDFTDVNMPLDPVVHKFVNATGAKLHLLCITNTEGSVEEILSHMNQYAEIHDIKNYEIHIHHESKIYKGIMHFSELDSMHMVVLGTHGRKGVQQLINSSIAEKLVNHLYKPLLVYKI